MKNIGYTLKRYKIWVIAIIIVILAIVSLTKSKTIEDYFLSNYESADSRFCITIIFQKIMRLFFFLKIMDIFLVLC